MVDWVPLADTRDLFAAVAAGSAASRAYAPDLDVTTARLARQIRHSGRATIGLLPAGRSIGDGADTCLLDFACELAFGIGVLTHTLTVVFDPEQASGAPPSDETFYAHIPAPNVAFLVPATRAPVGARFEVIRLLAQWIERCRDAIGQVLVDLRGCRLPGELTGVTHLLDGIILVGKGGRLDERELSRASRMVPRHLDLGVVLASEAK